MRFATLVKFTPQGVAGVGETTKRAKEFTAAAEAAGVKIQDLLWTQGRYDGIILYEAADVETAAATMLKAASSGNVQTETMIAFDAAEMDKILARAT